MRGLVAGLILFLVLAVHPLAAQQNPTIAGQDDPALAAALDDWLRGQEARALPALAGLAQKGNAAAQILLGLIDTTPAFQGDWLAQRSRGERIALLRAPGGVSGRNWMYAAAETEPLARAWVQLWDGGAEVAVMLDFARMGESRAAAVAAKRLARRDRKGFAALADDPAFPAIAMALAIREWQATDPVRAAAALAALHPGDPGRRLLGLSAPAAGDLLDWAVTSPSGTILDHTLRVLCPRPEERAETLARASDLIGGWWGIAELGPPSEALIPAADWAASVQGATALVNGFPDLQPTAGQGTGSDCLDSLLVLVTDARRARRQP